MKLIFFLALVSISLVGCIDSSYSTKHDISYAIDSISVLPDSERAVAKIAGLAETIRKIDSLQNGVCDTCVTGYQSAIIENRKVAERLSEETAILNRKIQKVERQIQSTDSLLSNNEVQLSHLRAINQMAKREKNKQKNEYYSLAKGN